MPAPAAPPPATEKEYNPAESNTPAKPIGANFRESLEKAAAKGVDAARRADNDAPTPDPAAPAAPAAPITPTTTESPKGDPKALREAHEKAIASLTTAQARLKELEDGGTASAKTIREMTEKVTALETRAGKLADTEARLKQIEGDHELALEKLRIADYVQHPEFHEKFVKPVAAAVQSAQALMKELVIEDATTGAQRQATDNDFMTVLRAPNLTEAMRRSTELFGPSLAQMIVVMRNNVIAAENARTQAFESAALRSKEALERQQKTAQDTDAKTKAEFDQVSNSMLEGDEGFWRPNPTQEDKDAAAAFNEAVALADGLVNGNPKWTAKERIEALARVRHRAASYPVVRLQVKRLTDENATLKARLKEFESKEPGAGGGGRDAKVGESTDPKTRRLGELQGIADRSRR